LNKVNRLTITLYLSHSWLEREGRVNTTTSKTTNVLILCSQLPPGSKL